MRLFLHKLTHWEYWPFQVVYIPVYFQWVWYSLRSGTIFFFNAANPSIRNGGFFMESKKAIYDLIPEGFYPKTILVKSESSFEKILKKLERSKIQFPLIVKPDMGQRGTAVKKILCEDALLEYASRSRFDFLIQELIPYPNEVGIFYVRYPNENRGRITGIVSKEFLSVTGDGISSVENLLRKNPRFEMQLPKLKAELGAKLDEILPKGEKLDLVPFGNHIRGSKFTDASDLISENLTDVIDQVCSKIPGFYFGRIDLMYDTWEKLESGRDFSFVEVNGSASEPTHMYDPKHSIFFGWKELSRHLRYMFEIGRMNHKNGISYLGNKEGIKEYREYLSHNKKITSV